jgi:superkiller protein 3
LEYQLDVTYAFMASCYSSKKEYYKAIGFANKSLNVNAENSYAHTVREFSYQYLISDLNKKKKYQEAIILYHKAIEEDKQNNIYPWAADIYGSKGLNYIVKNEYEKAIEPLLEAIRLNPEDGNYYNNLGFVYMQKKEYDKAIKFYKQALEIYANYKSLEELPNWEHYPPKAAKIAKNKKKNAYSLTYSLLGTLYFKTKKYKKAIEVYEKYLEYKPDDVEIKGYLKSLYKEVNSTSLSE